jgi:hypothetical protein
MYGLINENSAGNWELVAIFGFIGVVLTCLTLRWAFPDESHGGHNDYDRDHQD